MNVRTLVQAFGAAALFFLYSLGPQLSPHHSLLYHSYLPMQSVLWGLLIDLAAGTAVAAMLFVCLDRSEHGRRNLLWAFVAAQLIPPLVLYAASLARLTFPPLGLRLLFYTLLLGGLACRWLRPFAYARAVRAGRMLLFLVGCSGIWIVPELTYMAMRPQKHDGPMPTTTATPVIAQGAVAQPGPRMVWLLFDELSYDQVFEHRVPGLALSAFDDLKKKSTLFRNLQPVGYNTDRVLPSLFLGRPIEEIKSNLDGQLSVRPAGNKQWETFDASRTIFSDARRLGWTTGLAGWYNPYCRILAGTLNYCFWRMGNGQWTGTSPSQSAVENAMAPIAAASPYWPNRPSFPREENHQADLKALMAQANTLIRDEQVRFIFIHLPIPHPPGIYDRHTESMRLSGTYIDNLALADRVLAELMATIAATSASPQTTVIVSSDHSWRRELWRPAGDWTPEEEQASRHHFDPRPVLMIHSPGQTEERDVVQSTNALTVHDIVEHVLQSGRPSAPTAAPKAGAE